MLNTGISNWFGKAFCVVDLSRPEYADGTRGACIVFACRAAGLIEAIRLTSMELEENGLNVRGIE
jgi:hypothetical protein